MTKPTPDLQQIISKQENVSQELGH
jgi:hypothetical protein